MTTANSSEKKKNQSCNVQKQKMKTHQKVVQVSHPFHKWEEEWIAQCDEEW